MSKIDIPDPAQHYLVRSTEAYVKNEQCRNKHQKNQDSKKREAVPYRQCRFYFTKKKNATPNSTN